MQLQEVIQRDGGADNFPDSSIDEKCLPKEKCYQSCGKFTFYHEDI